MEDMRGSLLSKTNISQHKETLRGPLNLEANLDRLKELPENSRKPLRMAVIKLYQISTFFSTHFQSLQGKPTINVLSMACGISIEYLVFRQMVNQLFGEKIKICFVGIDNDASEMAKMERAYSEFPEVQFIVCDGSDKTAVFQALQTKNLDLSGGFDWVYLRHPDILTPTRSEIFKRMLREVIPFVSSKRAILSKSFYIEPELIATYQLINEPGLEAYSDLKQNHIAATKLDKNEHESPVQPGISITDLDSYCLVSRCHGRAFDLQYPPRVGQNRYPLAGITSSPSDDPHTKLLEETKAYDKGDAAKILACFNGKEKNYALALRKASVIGHFDLVRILLNYKDSLDIKINEPSGNGNTALDWADAIPAETQSQMENKQAVIKLLEDKRALRKEALLSLAINSSH